jgi:glycosyltransferase involved in cell wall biosynthesis
LKIEPAEMDADRKKVSAYAPVPVTVSAWSAMTRVDVSVVIPTRDRWSFLSRAVRTALAQRGVEVEVIVADDGSRTQAPRQPFHGDRRVSIVRQDPPRGVAAARNLGARHATGRWLAFLDDDDIWAPHKFASLLNVARQAGGGFAYSSVLMIAEDLAPLVVDPAPPADGLIRRMLERNAIPGGGSNVIVEKTLFDRVGGFDESLSFLADWDAWLRLAQAAPAAAAQETLTAYSCHSDNWVLRDHAAVEGDYSRLSDKHNELARQYGVAPDRVHYDRHIAASYFRAGRRRSGAGRLVQAGLRGRDVTTLAQGFATLLVPRSITRLRRRATPQAPAWLASYEPVAPEP